MRTWMDRASVALLSGVLGAAACNEILGIRGGEPAGGGGTAGTGAATSAGGGGTGGTAGASGGPCAGDAAPDGRDTLWVKRGVGDYLDEGRVIARHPEGGVVVAGTYRDPDFVVNMDKLPYPDHPDDPDERENVFVARYSDLGQPIWDTGFAGRDTQQVTSIAVDPGGTTFVGGYFLNTFQVGGTVLTAETEVSDVAVSGFVLKLGAVGNAVGARQLGGASSDEVLGVAVDREGKVLVAGVSWLGYDGEMPPDSTQADYGCGPRTVQKDVPTVFLSKLDPDGGCVWDRQYEIETGFLNIYNPSLGLAIAVAPGDEIVIAGGFRGTAIFGGGANLSSSGNQFDVFVAGIDKDGGTVWATSLGDENFQAATSVAVDPEGGIWIGGNYQQTVTLDPLPPQEDPRMDTSEMKAFIAKLEHRQGPLEAPTPVFLRAFHDVGWQSITSIAPAPGGDVVVGGTTLGGDGAEGIDFGDGDRAKPPGPAADGAYHEDGFVAKYCKDGGLRWVRRFSTPEIEEVGGVAASDGGETFVTGSFGGKYDFGGGQAMTPVGVDVFTLGIGRKH